MKTLISGIFLAVALTSTAEEYISPVTGRPVPTDGKYTVEQYKARDERVMKKTGGFIHQKAEGPLTLLVDTRRKERKTIDEVARLYKLGVHLDINIEKLQRDGKKPLAFGQEIMSAKKPLMVIVVVEDCEELPALSVFPEERIGIVNADKLKGEASDPTLPEMRVSKEVWRAIGFVGGIGFSAQENDMMQPYYTLEEIDGNNHPYIQPMNMAKLFYMGRRFGVKKERRIPYRNAVMEGWAAPPTNDYQKAVWDQVKADKERGPVKAIQIKP